MSLWAAMGLTRRHLPHMCHCLYSHGIAVHFACVTGAEANQAPCLWSAQSESPRLDMRLGAGWVGESLGASVSIGCSGTERSPDTIVLKRPCCCSAKSALSKHFLPLLCMHRSEIRLLYCFTLRIYDWSDRRNIIVMKDLQTQRCLNVPAIGFQILRCQSNLCQFSACQHTESSALLSQQLSVSAEEQLRARVSMGCSGTDRPHATILARRPCCCSA